MGFSNSASPLFDWLSPLQRRQQSFGVALPPDLSVGEALGDAPIAIVPERLAGFATVSFKASGVDLREYSK